MDFSRLYHAALLFIVTGCSTVYATSSVDPQWAGRYILNAEGETLNDGSRVQVTYDLNINAVLATAHMDLTTWHAPLTCQGKYRVQETATSLLLTHDDKNEECIYPAPQLEMTKKVDGFYIKGEMLAWYSDKWQKMVKKEPGLAAQGQQDKGANIKCRPGAQDIEYGYQTHCFYPGLSLQDAYKVERANRSDPQNMTPTVTPGKDRTIENLGDTDSVEYKWQGKRVLHVTQNFPGGVTEFLFKSDKAGTTVTETGYAD